MSWGVLRVGLIELGETYDVAQQVNAQTGEQSTTLTGRETSPPLTITAMRARREDILQLRNTLQPVTFSAKTELDGYYFIRDVGATTKDWTQPDAAAGVDWNLSLIPFGPQNAVDLESRLTGVVRANDFALSGTRWHAPPVAHYGYWTGTTAPASSVLRTLDTGQQIRIYTGIPAATDPRWGCRPADYLGGATVLTVDGLRRQGAGIVVNGAAGWELSNGLVRVKPLAAAGLLEIAALDSGVWATKNWDILVNAVALTAANLTQMTVLRNSPEAVAIRLVRAATGVHSRALIDLLLRRGSRFVEVFLQNDTSTTLATRLNTAEASTAFTGYVAKTADDAAGNRAIVGSARTFTADTVNGGLSKAATTTLDFWVGVILGGGAPATGDAGTELRDQYIGAMAEATTGVLR